MLSRIPTAWKHRSLRFDRSRFYICMMLALLISCVMAFIFPHRVPMAVQLDQSLLHLVTGVLGLGTCCCVLGFTIGSKYFFPNVDIRTAYRFAMYATPSNVTALGTLAAATGSRVHWDPVLFSTSALSTIFIIIAHLWVSWDLHWEVQRINTRIRLAAARVREDV